MLVVVATIRYQYRDHLGSSTVEADEVGRLLSYEEYYPYGVSAYRASASSADLSLKRYRFTNKEKDEETGLYYFGVRYYAAWLGRWTAADPGGFVDGLNLYRYVQNNPVNGVDEMGYYTEEVNTSTIEDVATVEQTVVEDGGGGGNPKKLYHKASVEAVESILKNGFDAFTHGRYSSYSWFSTVSDAAGTGVQEGIELVVEGIDVSKAHVITEAKVAQIEADALKELSEAFEIDANSLEEAKDKLS